jgi:dGTPase
MAISGIGFGGADRAPYASDPAGSRGRLHADPPSPTRTDYQRDRDRIVHSTAFRRLAGKTQVFLVDEGDHFRTRLTHTIEVAQIARAIARALRLDEDLAEALALAHDLGHTPFGHAGERGLARAIAAHGGFDHNAQSLRVVTRLERRYPRYDGLNLTWETLEGLVKHNGPLTDEAGNPVGRYAGKGIPFAIRVYADRHDLRLATYAGPEAQAASIADDIAYDAHDIDDGLRAGLLTLDQLREVPLAVRILDAVAREYPDIEPVRVHHELVRRLITSMIEDVIRESLARLAAVDPRSAEEVRTAGAPVVGFSGDMDATDRAIKAVLTRAVYRIPRVRDVMDRAERLVEKLYARYMAEPAGLPAEWRPRAGDDDDRAARRVADFIAGMTDRYALAEHLRLFDEPAELV